MEYQDFNERVLYWDPLRAMLYSGRTGKIVIYFREKK